MEECGAGRGRVADESMHTEASKMRRSSARKNMRTNGTTSTVYNDVRST